MTTFTINEENDIVVFSSAEEAAQAGDPTAAHFDSPAALAKLSAAWPLSRFVEIWNSIPGNPKINKFADRQKAVARIWKALQPLAANAPVLAPQPQPSAKQPQAGGKPGKAAAKRAKKATPAKRAAAKPKGERVHKKAEVLALLKRAHGGTLAEIMAATGWQRHTVRGFVSLLGSRGGETVESFQNEAGERSYKIVQ